MMAEEVMVVIGLQDDEMLKMAYCRTIGADTPHGLDCCDDYLDWLKSLVPNVKLSGGAGGCGVDKVCQHKFVQAFGAFNGQVCILCGHSKP